MLDEESRQATDPQVDEFLKSGCAFPDSFRIVDENMLAQKHAERNWQSLHKGRQLLGKEIPACQDKNAGCPVLGKYCETLSYLKDHCCLTCSRQLQEFGGGSMDCK